MGSREPLRVLEQGKGRVRLGFAENRLAAKWMGHGGRETRDSTSHQGWGGESEGRFPTWWPAGGLPVPRPWSLLTMDPNHVLQDEDSLCQDLQGLPQLLHPLALAGRSGQGQGHSASGTCCPSPHLFPPVTIVATTASICYVPGMACKFLFNDKKPVCHT